MKFSQRNGYTDIKLELEREYLSGELKNTLWSIFYTEIYSKQLKNCEYSENSDFLRNLWFHFYKNPIDVLPYYTSKTISYIREWYFNSEWYEILDFIEFCSHTSEYFQNQCNLFLKHEKSAYRFINNNLVEINSDEELKEIKKTLNNNNPYQKVKEHINQAIKLYSNRENPDYRNSIKESITAVECLSQIITEDTNTTLGQAIKVIEKKHKIPKSLKSAFSNLYGFTSNEGGIRHPLKDDNITIEMEDARFMLVTCSAFINYLLAKI